MTDAMTRPLFRFYVTYRDKAGDHDADEVWAESAEAAIETMLAHPDTSGLVVAFGNHACGPDDWNAVKLPDGRVLSRAEYERELAA